MLFKYILSEHNVELILYRDLGEYRIREWVEFQRWVDVSCRNMVIWVGV